MSSFTIHAIDPFLDARLSAEAKKRGTSKNQLVKELLARSLGLPQGKHLAPDYSEFCGVWSSRDAEEFLASQKDNSEINPLDWIE